MPALPLHEAGKYVAGAYVVFVALIGVYVAIMATRLSRMERDLGELHDLTDAMGRRRAPGSGDPGPDAPGPGPADRPDPAGAPVAGASR
jgi:hypothetical protein